MAGRTSYRMSPRQQHSYHSIASGKSCNRPFRFPVGLSLLTRLVPRMRRCPLSIKYLSPPSTTMEPLQGKIRCTRWGSHRSHLSHTLFNPLAEAQVLTFGSVIIRLVEGTLTVEDIRYYRKGASHKNTGSGHMIFVVGKVPLFTVRSISLLAAVIFCPRFAPYRICNDLPPVVNTVVLPAARLE